VRTGCLKTPWTCAETTRTNETRTLKLVLVQNSCECECILSDWALVVTCNMLLLLMIDAGLTGPTLSSLLNTGLCKRRSAAPLTINIRSRRSRLFVELQTSIHGSPLYYDHSTILSAAQPACSWNANAI